LEHFENLCEILQTDKKTLLNYHYSSKIVDELKEYPEYKEVLNIVNEQLAYQIQKQESLPIVYHGDADTYVPTWMVYPLYEAKPAPKELWIVRGAEHAKSYKQNPQLYLAKVKAFTDKYIK
jgi:abortive infection bacteriophage resistance protein